MTIGMRPRTRLPRPRSHHEWVRRTGKTAEKHGCSQLDPVPCGAARQWPPAGAPAIFDTQRMPKGIPGIGPGLHLAPALRYGLIPAILLLLGGYIFWMPLQAIFKIWMTSE